MIKLSIYCKNCGTENEDKYSYCKNCGTPLRATEQNATNSYKSSYNHYADKIPSEIDGIPSEDYSFFVGNNQHKILDKFAKMSLTGSKLAWCWPAVILSILFGFFGSAIWLFYRKMYRYGIIALAIGFLVLGINTAVTYQPALLFAEQVQQIIIEVMNSADLTSIEPAFENALNQLASSHQMNIAGFINETANYIAAFFYGLFGMYLYKKHAYIKIKAYRAANSESDYYNYGLSAIGGTTVGMAIFAVIIYIAASNILSMIPFISIFF